MQSLTVFKSPRWWEAKNRYVYDNKTHRRMDFDTWNKFVDFLEKLSKRPLEGKQDAELISPAVFKTDTTRKNDNVLNWAGWAAVDVDDHVFEGDLIDSLKDVIGEIDYVIYSTASSTIDQPKFRIVLRLNEPVQQENLRHFWYAVQHETGNFGDEQTKDIARMYYTPATYKDANNFFMVNKGVPLDVDYVLARWPYDEKTNSKDFLDQLPPAWREQIVEYRKGKLENTNFVWSGYQDCPFWPKQLAAEYISISGTGWYRQMYKIMIAIAGKSVEKGYPITATQIVELCKQFDVDTGKWYENRPMDVEANNALAYVYKKGVI